MASRSADDAHDDATRGVAVTTEIALVLGGLTAVALVVTYPLVRHITTHLPNDLGDPVLNAWILAWDATAIRHGFSHFWDAPSYFPYLRTLAYSDHLLGVALFTSPVQWLTANPVLAYNLAFIASFTNAGAGMYVLARMLTGRRDAAVVAALIYAFAPFRVAHFAHVQWLMTGWLPLGLWALHRYFSTREWRFLLVTGGAYLMQCLTASYFTYFALLPLALVAIAEIWHTRPPLIRTAAHLTAITALVLLTLAPIWHVYYQVRQEQDFRRSVAEIESLSADLGDYFRGHHHVWLWRHARSGTGEHELFPGAVALGLAGVVLLTGRGRTTWRVHVYAVVAVTALVLSLGPHPTAWGHRAEIPGPYQLLLDVVPGLDGLRAVSRMGVLVVLGLSVLAAQGAVHVLGWIAPRHRTLAVVGIALAVVAEAWAAPIPIALFAPTADPGDRAAYEFLRQRPEGAVFELPISVADEARELRYQYLTLVHGHRTVNGHSSYSPQLTTFLCGEESPLADLSRLDGAVEFVRGMGVRYVVVHRGDFESPAFEAALTRELESDRRQVVAEHDFGRTSVFTLADDDSTAVGGAGPMISTGESAAWRPIPISAIQARASHAPDRLPLLFDRDRDTRWLTAGHQNGSEWIEVELDSPRNVGLVRMQTAERSFTDYPRELAIEAVEAGSTRTLFHGSVLSQFGRGFAANHTYPNIDVLLPDNQTRVIRLRQLGVTHTLFWSIHELELWERGGRDAVSAAGTARLTRR